MAHDNVLGDFSTLSPAVQLMGHVRTGTDCFFGTGAVVKPRVTLAPFTQVSMGAVVRKDIVAPHQTVYGDPAATRERK